MSPKNVLMLSLLLVGAGAALPAAAGDETAQRMEVKQVIALKTDDFELAETDISDLAVGESETIVTESGKTIDILRNEDGIELYVDGVLQDINFSMGHGEHEGLHKEIEVICDAEEACDEMVWISDESDLHVEAGADGETHHVITREVRVECTDDEDCSEHNVWITDNGENVDLDKLEGEVHVIRLHEDTEASKGDSGDNKVIVIRKHVERD